MHVVIYTQYYPPEIGAPQVRLSTLAIALIKRGHQVTVLTAMPNYPFGRVYSGYEGLIRRETVEGVAILRSWVYVTKNASFLSRLLNYFSFVFSSLLLGTAFLGKVDVVFTESPPLFLGISGYILSRLKKAHWIFNVSDLWPESAVRLGVVKNQLVLQLSYWLESFFYRKAWLVSGQSKEILRNIKERFPYIQTYHLSNGTNTSFFAPERFSFSDKADGVIALYAGLHGLAQGLDQILLAAHRLHDLSRLKFILVGDGPLKSQLLQQAQDLKLSNMEFLDPLLRSEMPQILASSDFCIVPLGLELPGAVPSKLYEAMAAGRAILLIAKGEAADIVIHHNCGLVVTPGDIDSLVRSLHTLSENEDLRKQLGANGRQAAVKYYNHREIMEEFINFLESN